MYRAGTKRRARCRGWRRMEAEGSSSERERLTNWASLGPSLGFKAGEAGHKATSLRRHPPSFRVTTPCSDETGCKMRAVDPPPSPLPRFLIPDPSSSSESGAEWIAPAETNMFSTVKVHNVSLQASERVIKEFFSFSGDIVHVEMQSGDGRSQFAYITFRDEQGAERAMLLTGATIVDMAVIITPATNYQLPAAVLDDLESKSPSSIEAALRKAEDVAGSMLAKGFILGKDAVEKAKTFDETHQLTSTASAKVSSIDKSLGLSEKISTGTIVVNEKMKEMDEKYQVAEKTKSALVAAEQTVSTAGSKFMRHRYILTGAAWVTGAYSKVATTATEAYNKERAMAEQEDELVKSSEEAGQESKCQEGDPAKVSVPENTETGQMADQEGECPKTNKPEDTETGKDEQKSQDGDIAKAQTQENTEITAEEHKHQEAELPKASTPESLLMAEQTEQEHKQPVTEVANSNIPSSPVTIAVCMATDDAKSSNSPKKPGPA
ncbi:uncharacterized protein LOC125514247 [Triticum urartu]|uniref:RRM domain-containing protein n=2 Tax=Triticum TaxID=4564 RepID=A0A8R7UXJ3_TRIUA|nr:uncharacterized protein LOC123128062 isoform X2 [Triticum aestivum]XP_048535497.1 uncharacterized protein LOC125514247 [Triticum urartu]